MNRRAVLALTSGALAAALAGCSGDGTDDETPREGTPTDQDTPAPTETPDPTSTATATPGDTDTPGSVEDVTGDPLQTFDDYISAVRDSDAQAAIGLLHEDSEQTEENISNDMSYFSDRSIAVVDRSIIDVQDGDVIVRGVLETSQPGTEDANRIGIQMSLRRGEDDEWLIYDARGYQLSDGTQGTETDENGAE